MAEQILIWRIEMRRKKFVCAFLDILGFRNYITKDLLGASNLIMEYHNVLELTIMAQKLSDANKQHVSQNPELDEANLQSKFTSFDYFLPFSDSIFIISSNPDLFVAQVSSFLSKCLTLIEPGLESDETSEDPFQKGMRKVTTQKKGQPVINQIPVFKWPLLFRGGISYGECHPMKVASILNGQKEDATILLGESVVEAVQFEGKVKGNGPALMCSKSFFNSLSKSSRKYLVKVQDHFEVLWPAFRYYDLTSSRDGGFQHRKEFDELFEPAVRWWKACNHLEHASHYYNFIKLIIESTLHYYSLEERSTKDAKRYINNSLEKHGLLSKANHLMKDWE
jgi:hypothetical protein